jgi:ribosomal 50S subunit-recycling heat shock protein
LGQRLDKWLVYARFAKHRSTAAELIETGKVRLNRERVAKCSQTVKPGDVLTIAIGPLKSPKFWARLNDADQPPLQASFTKT